eukprot:TRINITY_DN2528_c2_g1_i2.p11 TRINITY_DN2528_c2_g1~~TRINITY_DN2528_c2_g1_i2.p11  ORF type:complete len:144 (-),score=17.90 TRINITY_DN2528_c2_g1_i2:1612-2043(-)
MRRCFLQNGGLYVKLGQLLSQLTFIVPPIYQEEMEKCCIACPRSNMKAVREVIQGELGKPIEEVFSEFDPDPVASASLAQVHKARLKSTGEIVAVKVQHKWVQENYPGDVKVMDLCIWVGEKVFPTFKYKVFNKLTREIVASK